MSRPSFIALSLFLTCFEVTGLSAARGEEKIDYLRQVKPLIAARCYTCHGALKQKAELRLDTVALMKKGGSSGSAVVIGKSAKSLLVEHITGSGEAERMPP